MSSPPIGSSFFHAAGSVVGATGVAVAANNASFARTGPGVYTATLIQGLFNSEIVGLATLRGGPPAGDVTIVINQTSDTVKTIFVTAAGVPIDLDFDVVFLRVGVGL